MDTRALLWGEPTAPRRGPKPTLDLATIARTGIDIADTDGLAAVTMQRVADTLGVTKMALYRYLPGKAELVALMTDIGLGAPPPPAPGTWRDTLHAWAQQMFHRFRQHPWALETTVGARVMGPNELDWLERAAAALTGTGLTTIQTLDVVVTLVGHVRHIVQQTAGPTDTEQALQTTIADLLRDHQDRYPALAAAFATPAPQADQNQALDFGLHRILDGVELLITSRGQVPGSRPSDLPGCGTVIW